MARLRAPGGCPWDREQTFDTIKPYLLEETYEVLDAIDAPRLGRTAGRARRPHAAGRVLLAQMAAEAGPLRHRRRARRHQREARPPPSARLRRARPPKPPATCARSGARSRPGRRSDKGEGAEPLLGGVSRGRCRRWWRRSRSPRARRTWASTGRTPSRCWRSSAKSWREFHEARRNGVAGGAGRRARRPAVRAGQPGALREGGPRTGAAENQRQVPRALRISWSASSPEQGKTLAEASIEEMEALWQEVEEMTNARRSSPTHRVPALTARRSSKKPSCLQKRDLGLRRTSNCCRCACSWWPPRSAARLFGAFDGGRMIAFCLAIPGLKPGGRYYLHSHMLGVLPEYRNLRRGAAAQAGAAGGRAGARHRADGVDLRSARDQERLLQHGAAGRHRAALRAEPVRHHHQPPARRPAHGPLRRRVVDRRTERVQRGVLAGAPRRRARVEARIDVPSDIAEIRREEPKRAREIQQRIGEQFAGALRRAGWR